MRKNFIVYTLLLGGSFNFCFAQEVYDDEEVIEEYYRDYESLNTGINRIRNEAHENQIEINAFREKVLNRTDSSQ